MRLRALEPRLGWSLACILFALASICLPISMASAAQLLSRSVTLTTGVPGATTAQKFDFTFQTAGSLGSLKFQYCSNSPRLEDPCTLPNGLNISAAQLNSQSGNSGFSIYSVDQLTATLIIGRPTSPVALTASSYDFSNIVNPSAGNATVFVRITSYTSSDGTGTYVDNGTVAYSTNSILTVGAYVPPYLTFCTGKTVASDCSSSATSLVDLGTLRTASASSGTSQMAAATNDNNGYFISMFGTTLTSGNQAIPALASPTTSQPGTSQFGINLRDNSTPDVGLDPSGDGTASPSANYNLPNNFLFNDGDTVVEAPNSTAYNRMTVSYMANISSSQAPGIYTTTISFIATAQF